MQNYWNTKFEVPRTDIASQEKPNFNLKAEWVDITFSISTIHKHKVFSCLVNQTHQYAPYASQEIKSQNIYDGFVLKQTHHKNLLKKVYLMGENLLKEGGINFGLSLQQMVLRLLFEHFGV